EVDRFPSSPVQWRDKAILKLDPASVAKIEVVKDKDKTVLERVDDKTFKATTPAGFTDLDQPRVQGLVRQISTLRASRIVEGADPKALGLDKPRAVVTVTKKDGQTIKLTLGPVEKAGTDGPVSVSGQKDIYNLPDFQAQALIKAPADFKKAAAPA